MNFSFEKIGLDEADYRFVKDLKPSVWLKKARVNGKRFLFTLVWDCLKNEVRSRDRRREEAGRISSQIYEKMVEAGFVRDISSYKNLSDFLKFSRLARVYDVLSFQVEDLFWLGHSDRIQAFGHSVHECMDDTCPSLCEFANKIPTPARLANSKLYEKYDFTELDNAMGEILHTVLTESQRIVLERVAFADNERFENGFTLVLTKEEAELYKTGIVSLVLNAWYIEKKLSPYVPPLLKRKK